MVSAVSQTTAPAAESTETASTDHWLKGRYFVPMPDLSDETRWEVSQGRAWPVLTGLMVLLHDLERRGSEPQRAAAVAGRIEHLGVNGLAAAVRVSPKAVLRQLRFLERRGLIQTSQGTFTAETDPVTGRIVRNYAKAPPKVIQLTLADRHYRPTAPAREPRRDTHETTARRQGDTHETTRKVWNPPGRNDRVSRERTSKEVRSSGTNRRQDASGPRKGPETPAAKVNPSTGTARQTRDVTAMVAAFDTDPAIPGGIAKYLGLDPAEVASTPAGERREELIRRFYAKQGWLYDPATNRVSYADPYSVAIASGEYKPAESSRDRQTRQRLFQTYVANCSKSLKVSEAEVMEIGRADPAELVRRLHDAGADPSTGRPRRRGQWVQGQEPRVIEQEQRHVADLLDVRQAVTAAVSLHDEPQEATGGTEAAGDTSEADEAAERLRGALAAMTPAGRDRAHDLGEQIDEHLDAGATEPEIDAEAAELAAVIERKRADEASAKAAAERDMAELAAAKDRQDRDFAELKSRLGSAALRQNLGDG